MRNAAAPIAFGYACPFSPCSLSLSLCCLVHVVDSGVVFLSCCFRLSLLLSSLLWILDAAPPLHFDTGLDLSICLYTLTSEHLAVLYPPT